MSSLILPIASAFDAAIRFGRFLGVAKVSVLSVCSELVFSVFLKQNIIFFISFFLFQMYGPQ